MWVEQTTLRQYTWTGVLFPIAVKEFGRVNFMKNIPKTTWSKMIQVLNYQHPNQFSIDGSHHRSPQNSLAWQRWPLLKVSYCIGPNERGRLYGTKMEMNVFNFTLFFFVRFSLFSQFLVWYSTSSHATSTPLFVIVDIEGILFFRK